MKHIRRRLSKAEKTLSMDKPKITLVIARFGGELPPDRTEGNITYHYVLYDEKAKQ